VGQRIVGTATDAHGNTSEFSPSFTITAALLAPAAAEGESGAASVTLDASAWRVSPFLGALPPTDADAERVAFWTPLPVSRVRSPVSSVKSPVSSLPFPTNLLADVMDEMSRDAQLSDVDAEADLVADWLQSEAKSVPTLASIDEVLAAGDWFEQADEGVGWREDGVFPWPRRD
jgi:hypothetical protein